MKIRSMEQLKGMSTQEKERLVLKLGEGVLNTPIEMTTMTKLGIDNTTLDFETGKISKDEYLENLIRFCEFYGVFLKDLMQLTSDDRRRAVIGFLEFQNKMREKHSPAETKNIKCKRGCSNCCYQQVNISEDEAIHLRRVYSSYLGNKTLEQQIDTIEDSPEGYRKAYPAGRCTFLGADNSCAIYEDRPVVCRLLKSFSGPETCHVQSKVENKTPYEEYAEWAVTVFWNCSKVGSMPKMILDQK